MDRNGFRGRAFTRAEANAAGISDNMLRTKAFRRMHQGVYTLAADEVTADLAISAARLAVPPDAKLSHLSRIHALGLPATDAPPIHFTIARDLHLARTNVVLHRTALMPPTDDIGVTPAAALVQIAGVEALRDVFRLGDWLLRRGQVGADVQEICESQSWRPGAWRLLRYANWFNGRSASFPETDCRVYLKATGLPEPLVNVPILDSPHSPVVDLWIPEFRVAIEHEGRHHFDDPRQVKRDVWRYAVMRDEDVGYLQAHREIMRRPKAFVHAVHATLVRRGYRGPPPGFGRDWRMLFARPRNTMR